MPQVLTKKKMMAGWPPPDHRFSLSPGPRASGHDNTQTTHTLQEEHHDAPTPVKHQAHEWHAVQARGACVMILRRGAGKSDRGEWTRGSQERLSAHKRASDEREMSALEPGAQATSCPAFLSMPFISVAPDKCCSWHDFMVVNVFFLGLQLIYLPLSSAGKGKQTSWKFVRYEPILEIKLRAL